MAQDHSQLFLCATQNQETLIKFNRGLTFINNRERSLQQIQCENSNPLALSPSLQISTHCPFQLCVTNQEKCLKKIICQASHFRENQAIMIPLEVQHLEHFRFCVCFH